MNLADFSEQISDDFQSTFTVIKHNVLVNIMLPNEEEKVREIILKYLPDAQVKFHRGSDIGPKAFYFIEVTNDTRPTV